MKNMPTSETHLVLVGEAGETVEALQARGVAQVAACHKPAVLCRVFGGYTLPVFSVALDGTVTSMGPASLREG